MLILIIIFVCLFIFQVVLMEAHLEMMQKFINFCKEKVC